MITRWPRTRSSVAVICCSFTCMGLRYCPLQTHSNYVTRMNRQNISSGAPWEAQVGYSRAVRIGPHVWVSGTTAVTDGVPVHPGDVYAQTLRIWEIITQALAQAGADLSHVVRTRAYLTDLAQFNHYARAHAQAFGAVRPAATAVQVAALVHPDLVVEVEVEAYVA